MKENKKTIQPISSRTKENSTILSFVNKPQTLTVPCSLFPVP
ncbi:hypothetical protein [Coleofasciculus sp. E1-EBD-02]